MHKGDAKKKAEAPVFRNHKAPKYLGGLGVQPHPVLSISYWLTRHLWAF